MGRAHKAVQADPTGSLSARRELHDGAGYTLTAAAPGVIVLAARDAHGGEAHPAFDRAQARQLIEDIELVAGLRPTAAKIDLAAALAGSLRILLQRIDDDLERADPGAADQLRLAMIAHLRSKRPALLGGGAL